ncbi:MAG TPA: hypothetical protein VHA06_05375, partial [Candidatus Angelobacter sp.]|nr:hypothetical protein [Candidatus Angelobacter sp.]
AQDDTLTLEQFLELLAETVHRTLKIIRVPREKLEQEGLLPECSPFSGQWMSSIESARSKAELGMQYTPMSGYVKKLVSYYQAIPTKKIEGYAQREKELKLAQER